ncbi:MAG: neuromedin U [Deltaproteobacteria bacterium]|nr:neuromedin U [Deltaproteobacteria bacterium]
MILLTPAFVSAQSGPSEEELARKAQNPIADLISVPFQNNTNFNVGPSDNERTQDILNIQPVIPFQISEDWNLITRTITPLIWQPTFGEGSDPTFGLGDINPTFFFSPRKPGEFIWGVGPTATFPTATDDRLGSGKWSMGPAAVGLVITGPWVVGALVNNQWSVGGESDRRSVNQFLFQYFINYNFKGGWYLTSAPILTSNWNAPEGDKKWTVPFGGGVGKIFHIGRLPVNAQVQSFYNVQNPDYGSDWSLRTQLQFLFPK